MSRTNIVVKDEEGYNYNNSYTTVGQYIYGPTTGPSAMFVVGKPGSNSLGNPVPALNYTCTSATALIGQMANPYHPVAVFNGDVVVTGRLDPIGIVAGDENNNASIDSVNGILLNTDASSALSTGVYYNNLNGASLSFDPQFTKSYEPIQFHSDSGTYSGYVAAAGGLSSVFLGPLDPSYGNVCLGGLAYLTTPNTDDEIHWEIVSNNTNNSAVNSLIQKSSCDPGYQQIVSDCTNQTPFLITSTNGDITIECSDTNALNLVGHATLNLGIGTGGPPGTVVNQMSMDGTNIYLYNPLYTSSSVGTAGQVLTSSGTGAAPYWAPGGGGGPPGISITVSSGSPIVLDTTSQQIQVVTGTSDQIVTLPSNSFLGQQFQIKNTMAANVIDIEASDLTALLTVEPETGIWITSLLANGTTYTNWSDV